MIKAITWEIAFSNFCQDIRPSVIRRYGLKDTAAIRHEWGVYIDGLCRDGLITVEEYDTWANPF